MRIVKRYAIRLSIWTLEKFVFWLLEAKKKLLSKLDTDWQPKLSELQLIGCACSLPQWEKPVYSKVSIMFPHLSKRQIYAIIDKRKKLDEQGFLTKEASLIFREKCI